MLQIKKILIKVMFFLAFFPQCFALDAPTFGPEFEFVGKHILELKTVCFSAPMFGLFVGSKNVLHDKNTALRASVLFGVSISAGYLLSGVCDRFYQQVMLNRLARVVEETCVVLKNCKVELTKVETTYDFSKKKVFRVQFDDGYWIQLNTDPGVIEVQSNKIKNIEKNIINEHLTNALFNPVKKMGLKVSVINSAGHINIGYHDTFSKNPKLLRNFIVDMVNHYEISEGVLNKDWLNARSMKKSKKFMKKFKKIILDFDNGEIRTSESLIKALEQGPFRNM